MAVHFVRNGGCGGRILLRTSGDLIRPAGGSSMDQFEATIRDSPTTSAMQLAAIGLAAAAASCC